MTSKNNRALLLYFVNVCASFQMHWWIQTGVTVQKSTLNSGQNWRYFILCDLVIWWMTLENNRAPLLYHIKLCASFQSHRLSQTWVTVRKRSIRVKIGHFFAPCDLEIWQMTLKNNRAPLLCSFKLCASFHSHWWIQTGVTVRKRSIWVKIADFFICDLEIWWMTLKNKRAHLLYYIKLCASFQSHELIESGVTVRKRSIQVKIGNFLSRATLKSMMTLKNNRASLLCCFKLCASFHSHWWI